MRGNSHMAVKCDLSSKVFHFPFLAHKHRLFPLLLQKSRSDLGGEGFPDSFSVHESDELTVSILTSTIALIHPSQKRCSCFELRLFFQKLQRNFSLCAEEMSWSETVIVCFTSDVHDWAADPHTPCYSNQISPEWKRWLIAYTRHSASVYTDTHLPVFELLIVNKSPENIQ